MAYYSTTPSLPKATSMLTGGIFAVAVAGIFALTNLESDTNPEFDKNIEVAAFDTPVTHPASAEKVLTRRGLRPLPTIAEQSLDAELPSQDQAMLVTEGKQMTRRGLRAVPTEQAMRVADGGQMISRGRH